MIPTRNKKNTGYAKFWGANKVYYWRCANAEWINDGEKNDTKKPSKGLSQTSKT